MTTAWRTDTYFSMGILGFGLYILLGITSLPSVSNALSWREFSFIQVDAGMCVWVIWYVGLQMSLSVWGSRFTGKYYGHRIQISALAVQSIKVWLSSCILFTGSHNWRNEICGILLNSSQWFWPFGLPSNLFNSSSLVHMLVFVWV